MTEMVYKWTRGSRFTTEVTPQAAGEELERIRKKFGNLTAEYAVAENSEPGTPLHPIIFQWDDERAIYEHRLEQARHIIRSVVIVTVGEQPERPPIRAFVSIKENDESSYTHINIAMADPEQRAQYLARALREAESWRRRYQDVKEFAAIFEAMDAVFREAAE